MAPAVVEAAVVYEEKSLFPAETPSPVKSVPGAS